MSLEAGMMSTSLFDLIDAFCIAARALASVSIITISNTSPLYRVKRLI
jgi:hypothetical protein